MANTYVAIANVTVGSGGASSIDFTSIPQTYTDLMIVASVRATRPSATGDQLLFTFNNNTTNRRFLTIEGRPGTGNPVVSFTDTTVLYWGQVPASSSTASTFGNGSLYVPNYTSSNNKTASCDLVNEGNYATAYQTFTANLWSNSAAITQITLYMETAGSNIAQHSTATLYGIKNTV